MAQGCNVSKVEISIDGEQSWVDIDTLPSIELPTAITKPVLVWRGFTGEFTVECTIDEDSGFIKALQDIVDFENGITKMALLTNTPPDELRSKFTEWIGTQAFSWRVGMRQCVIMSWWGALLPWEADK